jgi:molecular chaperone DnaK
MTVTGGSALGKDDISRMVKEAEEHAEEDRKRREGVELRNEAETLVFRTEKLLSENEDKITSDVREPVEESLKEVKTALEGEDNEAVKTAVDKLNTTSAALGQAMYAAAQAAQQAEAPSEAGAPSDHAEGNGSSSDQTSSDDDVVDAEIVDEDSSSSSETK